MTSIAIAFNCIPFCFNRECYNFT